MLSSIANCGRLMPAFILSLCVSACGGGGGNAGNGPVAGGEAPTVPSLAPPAIGVQPSSLTVSTGASVSFAVGASGGLPLSYQWLRNGVEVPGATDVKYTLPAAQFADSGSKWRVVVRNGAGSVTSAEATLTVTGTALLAGALQANSFSNGQLAGIAQDGSGNTYLLDRGTAGALFKVSAEGVTTLLPLVSDSRTALYQPSGIARDAAGHFYVTDSRCAVRKISPAGEISVLAGEIGLCGHADGKAGAASFGAGISAIAVDAASNVFVADHQATIRKITPDGVVTTVAGTANAFATVDGTGSAARFGDMTSMTVDGAGNIYVTDAGVTGTAPSIRKVTPGGIVSTLAGGVTYGFSNGRGGNASFAILSGLTIDAAGNLYAGDQGSHTIRKITPDGDVTTFAGQLNAQGWPDTNPVDGPAATATFRKPVAMTADGAGNIFVAESEPGLQFNALRKISAVGVVSTVTGTLSKPGAVDGSGPAARFARPHDLAVDGSGKVWVADTNNQLIRQISAGGAVTTLAGASGFGIMTEQGDGKGTQARFMQPMGIVIDNQGAAYVADAFHQTIRKVLGDGTVSTVAGQVGRYGQEDGIGTAARFSGLAGLAIDRAGTLYVADGSTVRRVDPVSGQVTTLAGTLATQGAVDGKGTAARFGNLSAIAADSEGNLYVTDSMYSTVRKITPDGVVTTFAGMTGINGLADGHAAAARFNQPEGITLDSAGNVYVADTGNNLVRRITPAGVVTTIAGQMGANGNVPGSLTNPLSQPRGLAFDANGILYVCASNAILRVYLDEAR